MNQNERQPRLDIQDKYLLLLLLQEPRDAMSIPQIVDVLQMEHAEIFVRLNRLEDSRWVQWEVNAIDVGTVLPRKERYYELTDEGARGACAELKETLAQSTIFADLAESYDLNLEMLNETDEGQGPSRV